MISVNQNSNSIISEPEIIHENENDLPPSDELEKQFNELLVCIM